jgi:hypothetical protein
LAGQPVAFIEDQYVWNVIEVELSEDVFDRFDLSGRILGAGIHEM